MNKNKLKQNIGKLIIVLTFLILSANVFGSRVSYTPQICLNGDCQTSWPTINGATIAAGWTNTSTTTSTNLNVNLTRSNLAITNGTLNIFSQANNVTVLNSHIGLVNITNTATGGTITTILVNGVNYTVHTFTTNGTFTPNFNGTVEYLIVAGGGGGGGVNNDWPQGGGGGAGGFRNGTNYSVNSTNSINVTIGNGGAGSSSGAKGGSSGGNSTFGSITSQGGGGGGGVDTKGLNGGSGGGGGFYANPDLFLPGNGTSGQGNNGGNGTGGRNTPDAGGGGGGAGGIGSIGVSGTSGGNGGNGLNSSINGSNVTYAGGGGGGITDAASGAAGLGGSGGGGNGGKSASGANAITNTGGGGGGNGGVPVYPYIGGGGGNGGSGIVIVRYQTISTINTTIYTNNSANISSNFILNNVGNVGIGTTTPNNKLDVNGTNGTYAGIYLNSAIPGVNANTIYNDNGALTWGSTSSDNDVLKLFDSDGTCLHNPESGSETVTCSSDARLKTNIHDAKSVIPDLMKLKVRDYTVIASGNNMTGLIAQETLQTIPELVKNGSDGYLMVSEVNSWKLVKAIQEQQSQLEKLDFDNKIKQNQIDEQNKKINDLKKLICIDHQNASICS